MAKVKIEGLKELTKTIQKMEKLPQKCVTKAAKTGAKIPLKSAKGNAPYLSGALEGGIVLKGEKTRVKGKKVYQVVMDSNKNDIFVKMSKSGKRSYYPASQEYGFTTKNGGYIPGLRYLKKSILNNKASIEKTMVNVLGKEIDKL